MELTTPVRFVPRIGDRIAAGLAERGVRTVEDLLYHLPFRYEDRLHPRPLGSYQPGDMATVLGEVRGTALLRTRSGPIFEMTVGLKPPEPGSEAALEGLLRPPPTVLETIKCLWFHGTWLKDKFHPGQSIALYGKLEASRSATLAARQQEPGSRFTAFKMIQPTFELLPGPAASGEDAEFTLLEMGRIVPVYESLGGRTAWGAKLTSRWLRRVIYTIFRDLAEGPASAFAETLPEAMLARLELPSRQQALETLHFPAAGTSLAELAAARTPAHRRLIFEEFFYLELGLELKRRRLRRRAAPAFVTDDSVRAALKQVLPFKPTAAQRRVLGEIVADLRRPQPMRRLLQGDVGSGKTMVAFQAALVAIENGAQVALMAPTEILATQHYLSVRRWLAEARSPRTGRPYRVALLTGSLDDRTKRHTQARILRGEVDLAIGTHALVEEKVDFANLGLVIVDEQHRFGVQQRFRLMRKPGADGAAPSEPHVLVMTATPIPRTLALTLYGDLEVSVIDELPPGRTPIATRRVSEDRAEAVWQQLREQVAAGRQAYIVYPLIENEREDGSLELEFPESLAEDLAEGLAGGLAENETEPTGDSRRAASLKPGAKTAAAKATAAKTAAAKTAAAKAAGAKAGRRKPQRQRLRSATEMAEVLGRGPLAGLKLGLLHGRMSAEDKEVAMARFQRGETQVLVSTTVIEVGVDVPNATLMVIEHADRFGLAQLHQLRGRVGRGAAQSSCVLVTGETISPEAELRLDAMVRTQNGFELAELDLQQRGPGEFFGTRQAGLPELRVASLVRDRELLELARLEAERFAREPDPAIPEPQRRAVWERLKVQWQRRYGLVEA